MDSAHLRQHLSPSSDDFPMPDAWRRGTPNDDDQDESELIAMATSSPEAFRTLYSRYVTRVYRYIASRVDSVPDAEDLTAETFVKVIKGLRQFEYRGEGSFAAWIFRIALNQVTGFHRRSPPKTRPLDDFSSIPSLHPAPEEWVTQQERADRVRAMLTMLSPRRQEIVTLRFYGGLRNQEIAVVLGLNERSVAAHLSRALTDLQQRYRYEDQDRDDDRDRHDGPDSERGEEG